MAGGHGVRRIIALAAIAIPFFLLVTPVPGKLHARGPVPEAWWDFGHVPLLAFLTAGLLSLANQSSRPGLVRQVVCWALLVFVPVVELLQKLTGRSWSIDDALYGWAGCIVGWIATRPSTRSPPWLRRASAFVLLAIAAAYPTWLTLEHRAAYHQFPLLSDFKSPVEWDRWKLNDIAKQRVENGWQLTIGHEAEYPGLFLRSFQPDWSGAQAVEIKLVVEGQDPLAVWVRFDDRMRWPRYTERFQQRLELSPGPQVIRLERNQFLHTQGGRRMDLATIRTFGMFFEARDAGRVLTLHHMGIELIEPDQITDK